MKLPRNRALAALGAAVAGLAIAVAAVAQEAPESLLPEGFGDPAPPPPREAPAAPAPGEPRTPTPPPTDLIPTIALAPPGAEEGDPAEEELEEAEVYELPDYARRPIDYVGLVEPEQGGYGPAAFSGADGRFLTTLMKRIDAPIASRWASIALRRALISRVPTPRNVAAPDWVAERAWLLLRMGEADAARMMVQAVDVDRFSRRLLAVTAQTALATGDMAAMCPFAGLAPSVSNDPAWPVAQAMCAALSGETAVSSVLIDRARQKGARGIDGLLAEKVIGAGSNSRRAVTLEWEGVDRLTAWRFGLASATGAAIPEPLFATVGPQVRAWAARMPLYSPAQRIPHARVAAALGPFSSAALVDLYAAAAEEADNLDRETPAGRLRQAYAGEDDDARLDAMRALWTEAAAGSDRYAALILTARAAAGITPSDDWLDDSRSLIASLFTAGLDRQAARWGAVVNAADNAATDDAWAMLALGTPRLSVDVSRGRVDRYVSRAGGLKAKMLVAGLAGLGRLTPADARSIADDLAMPLGGNDRYGQAIEIAVRGRQRGTMLLLAAAGMQTTDWREVSPSQFYQLISGLRRAGLSGEARMIAAEAIARL